MTTAPSGPGTPTRCDVKSKKETTHGGVAPAGDKQETQGCNGAAGLKLDETGGFSSLAEKSRKLERYTAW